METPTYASADAEALTLRDHLAIDRTVLANERTLLAYLRSAIALILAGVTFAHVFIDGAMRAVGFAIVPLGVAFGVLGFVRWRRMNNAIRSASRGERT